MISWDIRVCEHSGIVQSIFYFVFVYLCFYLIFLFWTCWAQFQSFWLGCCNSDDEDDDFQCNICLWNRWSEFLNFVAYFGKIKFCSFSQKFSHFGGNRRPKAQLNATCFTKLIIFTCESVVRAVASKKMVIKVGSVHRGMFSWMADWTILTDGGV